MTFTALSLLAASGAMAADFAPAPLTPPPTPSHTASPTPASTPIKPSQAEKPLFKGAKIVPDNTPGPTTSAPPYKKTDQGYSNMPTYNIVNDQNKPVTNDWTRPKSWRIGYKNKNRTPINE